VAYLNPALDGVIPYNQIVIYLFEQKTIQTIPANGGSIADYSLPNWSPSGDELVVGRHPPAGNPAQELWTMKLDGTPIEMILSDPSKNYVQYGWDPQGENLLIQAANLTNLKSSPEILLWDRMEKTPRILSDEGIWPAWLP
jgi:hypothetical protein